MLSFFTRIKGLLLGTAVFCALGAASASAQQGVMRIAAIVNDDLISVYDLQNRVRWVVLTSGIRPDESNQRRIIQQVLRDLVDERLRLQEAERLSVRVTEREIERRIEAQAQRSNLSAGAFLSQIASRGIDPSTVQAQVRANLAWNKLASRQLRRQIDVGEDEVDEELEKLREALSQPQKRLQEIFLAFDSEASEQDVLQTAERIVQQARGGADFSNLARGFSQNQTAQAGGDIGWVAESQMQRELQPAFRQLTPGQTSDPVRMPTGITILHAVEERAGGLSVADAQIDLFQIALPANQDEDQRVSATALLNEIRPAISSCETARDIAAQIEGATGAAANGVAIGTMPANLQSALAPLQVGETTEPVSTGRAVLIATVCARDEAGSALPSRSEIVNRIGTQRMELLARRYMRDLRREAFIDIRL